MRETSLNAYYNILSKLGERQEEILKAIYELPNCTDSELSAGLEKDDPNYVRPRRKELLDQGLITSTGKRKCRITGNLALTWEVVSKENYKTVSPKELLSSREYENVKLKLLQANNYQRKTLLEYLRGLTE